MEGDSGYENRIIAYVDILGFKTLIEESTEDSQNAARINTALDLINLQKEHFNYDLPHLNNNVIFTQFSDSAVISYSEHFNGGLFSILLDIIHMQLNLASLGIFIRGGVTIGKLFHNQDKIFGPAMNEAYELESNYAVYPRIILLEETLKRGVELSPEHNNKHDIKLLYSLVKEDIDGFYYIDYLKQSQELNHPESEYIDLLKRMRSYLVFNLNRYRESMNPHVFEKYRWLAEYWNTSVSPEYFRLPVGYAIGREESKGLFNELTRELHIDLTNYPFI